MTAKGESKREMAIPADKEKLSCGDMEVTWSLGVNEGDSLPSLGTWR